MSVLSNPTTLKDKKVLFFSPSFFSYEKKIKQKMEEMGATVYQFDERAVKNPFSRALLAFVPFVFRHKSIKYYEKILKDLSHISFDYILIVKGDMVCNKTIHLIRELFPTAKLCLHLWDSKRNIKGIHKKIDLFDFVSSFDRHDCMKDHRLHFRPLFYVDDCLLSNHEDNISVDLCFCGTIHSDRYFVIKRLFDSANINGFSTKMYGYLQAKFIFYFYKLFMKGFRKAKLNEFYFEKKAINEIIELENSAKVILDIQDPKQTGLTMRTIEMLGAQKKYITTNPDIVNYDFFDNNNIYIINRKNPIFDCSFFEKPYKEVPLEIRNKYCLEKWIIDVLGAGNNCFCANVQQNWRNEE